MLTSRAVIDAIIDSVIGGGGEGEELRSREEGRREDERGEGRGEEVEEGAREERVSAATDRKQGEPQREDKPAREPSTFKL